MDDVFESDAEFSRAKSRLREGDHALQKQKLIEFLCVDGIADNTRFKLTEEAKRDLLSEMILNTTEENIVGVSVPGDITQITKRPSRVMPSGNRRWWKSSRLDATI